MDDDEQERNHSQGEKGHPRLQVPHHQEHRHQGDNRPQHLEEDPPNERLHTVSIPGHAADGVAHGATAVVKQGKPLQVQEEIGSQVIGDLLAKPHRNRGAGHRQHRSSEKDENGAGTDPEEQAFPTVRPAMPTGWPSGNWR